jgi:hypothetical protein
VDAELFESVSRRGRDTRIDGLETGYVLRLKALRAFLYFKFHCLAFVQGLVSVHRDGREVDENILSCLPLDEAIPL